ncbi:UPF0149 family protein [Duganella sp. HH105]|uniref:UPF0149 family protein n=1 Tax=Duganella sp. HH105 TaxID=1781067 RepID=UPI000877CF3A|nr:UPF0149 family protein [Duganella sp. HH105]OEZ57731.1 hypothetical protein DUGA6_43710 [Duganella sp. HH105]
MQHTPLNDDEYDALDALQDVSWLEGFLTAVVIGPGAPAPESWLPAALKNPAAEPLALRHYHYMQTWMSKDPGSFEPIYECGGSWGAEQWCDGFMAGVQANAAAWAPLQASHPQWLAPFQQQGEDWEDAVTPSVIQINAYWHPPKGPKVGRNDPCPCGSGKKYKKCCADA